MFASPRVRASLGFAPQVRRCPRCGSGQIQRHGFFFWKDGTRRRRYLCRGCLRTFNPHTSTPLHYIKKRDEWAAQAEGVGAALSLRRLASIVKVQLATVFAWRHRLLGALDRHPQPRLPRQVVLQEAYVPYSEKGSRTTTGPGSRCTAEVALSRPRFRRFVDGKPSYVLVVRGGSAVATAVAGRGRPSGPELLACLSRLVEPGTELWCLEPARFDGACRSLRLRLGEGGRRFPWPLPNLHGWLHRFRGVATKYLGHYLTWYRSVRSVHGRRSEDLGRRMLSTSMIIPWPE